MTWIGFKPSTTSSDVFSDLLSSIVIAPSFPAASTASAIKMPMVSSPLAETEATCLISSSLETGCEISSILSHTAVTAKSIPLLISVLEAPAAI